MNIKNEDQKTNKKYQLLLTKSQMESLALAKKRGSNVQKALRLEVDRLIERMIGNKQQA